VIAVFPISEENEFYSTVIEYVRQFDKNRC